jgi:photosystem II stability/assembly factor-like uncharacterized protein
MPGIEPESSSINLDVDTRIPAASGPLAMDPLLLDVTRAGSRIVAVGERGIILLSDDEGMTWRQSEVPVQVLLTAVAFADSEHGWAVGHDAVILVTDNGGSTWRLQQYAPELDIPLLDILALNTNHVIATGALGMVFTTEDAGENWFGRELLMSVGKYLGMPESFDNFAPHWFAVDAGHDGAIYLAGERGMLARSGDNGSSWQQLTSPYNGSFFGLALLPENELIAYGMLGNAFASNDSGLTWQPVNTGINKSIVANTFLPDYQLVLAGMAGTIVLSDDGGATFTVLPQVNRSDILDILSVGKDELLVLTVKGKKRLELR